MTVNGSASPKSLKKSPKKEGSPPPDALKLQELNKQLLQRLKSANEEKQSTADVLHSKDVVLQKLSDETNTLSSRIAELEKRNQTAEKTISSLRAERDALTANVRNSSTPASPARIAVAAPQGSIDLDPKVASAIYADEGFRYEASLALASVTFPDQALPDQIVPAPTSNSAPSASAPAVDLGVSKEVEALREKVASMGKKLGESASAVKELEKTKASLAAVIQAKTQLEQQLKDQPSAGAASPAKETHVEQPIATAATSSDGPSISTEDFFLLHSAVNSASISMPATEAKVYGSQTQVQAAAVSVDGEVEEAKAALLSSQEEVKKMKVQVADLTKQLKASEGEASKAKTAVSKAEKELQGAKQKSEKAAAEEKKAQQKANELKTKLDKEVSSQKDKHTSAVKDFEEKLKKERSMSSMLDAEKNKLAVQAAEAMNSKETAEKELAEASKKVNAMKKNIQDLEKAKAKVEDDLKAAKAKSAEAANYQNQYSQLLQKHNSSSRDLNKKLEQEKASREDVKKSLADLKKQKKKAEDKIGEAEKKVASLSEELQQQKKKAKDASREMNKLTVWKTAQEAKSKTLNMAVMFFPLILAVSIIVALKTGC